MNDFTEHKDWSKKHPLGPVTWDGECSLCGFRVEDTPFDDGYGVGISGGGRRLAKYVTELTINGETFTNNKPQICCSACVV